MAKEIILNRKINNLIRKTIIETVQEILRDPDFGLELQEWVKKRLRERPRKLIPFEKIKKASGNFDKIIPSALDGEWRGFFKIRVGELFIK